VHQVLEKICHNLPESYNSTAMLTPNVGTRDKFIRTLIAVGLALLSYFNVLTGAWGMAALGVAVVLLLTGTFRFCPLYRLLGVRTCPLPDGKK
jgi:hypothetical protein